MNEEDARSGGGAMSRARNGEDDARAGISRTGWKLARAAARASGSCAAGLVGYMFGSPVFVVLAAAVTVAAVLMIWQLLLGDGDRRSPFTRFIITLCVLKGRKVEDYLPPSADR